MGTDRPEETGEDFHCPQWPSSRLCSARNDGEVEMWRPFGPKPLPRPRPAEPARGPHGQGLRAGTERHGTRPGASPPCPAVLTWCPEPFPSFARASCRYSPEREMGAVNKAFRAIPAAGAPTTVFSKPMATAFGLGATFSPPMATDHDRGLGVGGGACALHFPTSTTINIPTSDPSATHANCYSQRWPRIALLARIRVAEVGFSL